jgi:hypothetical protein
MGEMTTPGWHTDPNNPRRRGYWDGTKWSGQWEPNDAIAAGSPPLYLPNLFAAMIASIGIVVGSIGPWVTFLAMSRGATDGDGIITLILGIVAVGALFVVFNLGRTRGKTSWMTGLTCTAAVCGVACLGVAAYSAYSIKTRASVEFFGNTLSAEIGWGLWLLMISAAVTLAASVVVMTQISKL